MKKKKKTYNNRIINVEHGTCTPLAFSLAESSTFHKYIAQKYCKKIEENYEKVLSLIRSKLSFYILRSVLICVRGSRSVSNDNIVSDNVSLTGQTVGLF